MNHLITPARAVLLCAACLTTTAALADSAAEAPSVKLEISQAELHGPGVQKLYQRIQSAAREACAQLDSRELTAHLAYRHCVDDAVARAVADVHSKELTEVHLAAHGYTLSRRL
jgi:UrcA family protein